MRAYCDLVNFPGPEGELAEVITHLDAGGDPRAHNNTALCWACSFGHLDVVERLLSLGLTAVDARTHSNFALRNACLFGHLDVVERLLSLGLTADDARAHNNEALRWACTYGYLAVLERLIEIGLTADDARADDNGALRMACRVGHLDVLERLIVLGLTANDARARDNYALQMACIHRHRAVVARLLELGVVPTPYALVLCGAGHQVDDDTEYDWPQRLWRAVDRWEGSQELAVAESKLTPPQLESWETAKARARPSALRFAD